MGSVILPVANVLIHAANAESSRNERFREWWDECLSGRESVCLAWAVMLAYVRITTNPRILQRPLSVDQACGDVTSWLSQACVRIVTPLDGHWQLVHALLRGAGTAAAGG
jgi:predicted nucleic acid-binding protein